MHMINKVRKEIVASIRRSTDARISDCGEAIFWTVGRKRFQLTLHPWSKALTFDCEGRSIGNWSYDPTDLGDKADWAYIKNAVTLNALRKAA